MMSNTSLSSDVHHLTGTNEEQFKLHNLLKAAKFRLIGLNSSFIKRLNNKILDEFNLNERSVARTGERLEERETLNENHSNRNYQTINTVEQTERPEEPVNKRFKLKPKKRLLKLLRRFSLKTVYESMNMYEELKPVKDDEVKKKKKKIIKKIKKITMDVCSNIGAGMNLVNGNYSYPDATYGFNYDPYYDVKSMYTNYNGYDFKINDYNYNTTIIYGPRYM